MQLKFTINEPEALALSEQYYNDSASHQRQRNLSRLTLPILLLPIFGVFTYQFGLSLSTAAIFVLSSLAWVIIAPTRFDARIRRYMQKQMRESSYDKTFGVCTLTIDDRHLISDGPTGHTEYEWDAVDRVMLTDEFLFIFLAGASGFPIRISEIGQSVADEARIKLESLVGRAK